MKQMGWWIIPSSYRYQGISVYSAHCLNELGLNQLHQLSLPVTELPQLQQLSRGTRTPPCKGAKQEVLEKVLLPTAEVGPLFLQQGHFQGEKSQVSRPTNALCEVEVEKQVFSFS